MRTRDDREVESGLKEALHLIGGAINATGLVLNPWICANLRSAKERIEVVLKMLEVSEDTPKPPGIFARWCPEEKQLIYGGDGQGRGEFSNLATSAKDRWLVCHVFDDIRVDNNKLNFLETLLERGYDIETLKFECRKKVVNE